MKLSFTSDVSRAMDRSAVVSKDGSLIETRMGVWAWENGIAYYNGPPSLFARMLKPPPLRAWASVEEWLKDIPSSGSWTRDGVACTIDDIRSPQKARKVAKKKVGHDRKRLPDPSTIMMTYSFTSDVSRDMDHTADMDEYLRMYETRIGLWTWKDGCAFYDGRPATGEMTPPVPRRWESVDQWLKDIHRPAHGSWTRNGVACTLDNVLLGTEPKENPSEIDLFVTDYVKRKGVTKELLWMTR